MVFVTSRAITKEQQARNRGSEKYTGKILPYWNDKFADDDDKLAMCGIQLMTYDQMIAAINSTASEGSEVLHNVKIVIYDECHVLFSDEFISNMNDLRLWTREVIYGSRKLFIGLSATTKIIDFYAKAWGAPIRRINKEVVTGYRAKQLIRTNAETVPYLISANKLSGKTMIMCHSIAMCNELASHLSNAAVLVSKNSKDFTPEMNRIRNYIIEHEELPPTFFDVDTCERDLEVLIATSTLREGFNLRESSGVRNIITCMTDELHVTQFAGRCRYNIDNLVIADTLIIEDNLRINDSYIAQSRKEFRDYMLNKTCIKWFAPIQHLVEHDVYHIKKFVLGPDDNRFVNYINGKWLVPKGADAAVQQKYKIWRDADKDEIVELAKDCRLFSIPSRVSFIGVIKLLQNCLGYDVDSGQSLFHGDRHTYKLIVSYDPEQSNCEISFGVITEDQN